MEPCAPGTEDDPPIMYSTLTKQVITEFVSKLVFLKSCTFK